MKRSLISVAVVILTLPALAPARQPAARPLTLGQLGGLVEQLGCDVKPVENVRGERVGFEGKYHCKTHDVSMPFKALLAGDGSTLWLTVPLAKVEDVDGVPGALFLKLLSANRRVAPAFFAYSDGDCGLCLYLPAYAVGLTAEGLEQQLTLLARTMLQTRPLWDTRHWPVAGPKKGPAAP